MKDFGEERRKRRDADRAETRLRKIEADLKKALETIRLLQSRVEKLESRDA